MTTLKPRHQFHLSDELSEQLAALARKGRTTKTAIMTQALKLWIDRKAATELDTMFGPRLERQARAERRIEDKLDFLVEALGLFILRDLTANGNQQPFDDAARAIGAASFEKFIRNVAIGWVGQRIAAVVSSEGSEGS